MNERYFGEITNERINRFCEPDGRGFRRLDPSCTSLTMLITRSPDISTYWPSEARDGQDLEA